MRADVGEPRHTAPAASPIEGGLRPLDVDAAAAAALAGAVAARDRRRAIALADELYGAALYRFVRGLVGRDDLADDVYQTTLAEAYRDLGELADPAAVRAWLYAIARHRALDALKAARRRDARFAPAAELPELADPAAGTDQRLSDAELVAALSACLDRLAPELRMVLMLRFTDGFAYDDIARICRARPDAVRARVCRALPVLRRCIEQRGEL